MVDGMTLAFLCGCGKFIKVPGGNCTITCGCGAKYKARNEKVQLIAGPVTVRKATAEELKEAAR